MSQQTQLGGHHNFNAASRKQGLAPILPKTTAVDDTPKFGDTVARDVLEFISKDAGLQKSKAAIDSRLKDTGTSREANIKAYMPLVEAAVKKFYAMVGSQQRKAEEIFDAHMCDLIANKFVEDKFGHSVQ